MKNSIKNNILLTDKEKTWLFWGCFVALTAASFGFVSRAFMLADWQVEFGLTETQKGEIFGAGLWPFAISVILFSLVLDKIGYKTTIYFAFTAHIVSAMMTIQAKGYNGLYWSAFIGGLGHGTVEAVVNPVIATVYRNEKTKSLNVLHAGWSVGLVVAGVITILLGKMGVDSWRVKVGLVFIPTIIYGFMMIKCKFPVNERVSAGVSYKEMLAEIGGVGIFISLFLIFQELGRVLGKSAWSFSLSNPLFTGLLIISAGVSIGYGLYARALGRPMYIFLLFVMLLLATTEVATDGWIKDLMSPAMELVGLNAGWILVYTSLIMTILRCTAGPILRITKLSPLGLLSISCVMVIIGLTWLSKINTAAGLAILTASTIYGAGQCFFWPTTLGLISEQFPKGGALTLNAISGVGMLGVGILGGPWMGYIQNSTIETQLLKNHPVIYQEVIGPEIASLCGSYKPIDEQKVCAITPTVKEADERAAEIKSKLSEHTHPVDVDRILKSDPCYLALTTSDSYKSEIRICQDLYAVKKEAKSLSLFKVCVLPLIMLISYVGLMFFYKTKGGYRPVELKKKI